MGFRKPTLARLTMLWLSLPKHSIGTISIKVAASSFHDTRSWAMAQANGVFISSYHPAGSSMLITLIFAPPPINRINWRVPYGITLY